MAAIPGLKFQTPAAKTPQGGPRVSRSLAPESEDSGASPEGDTDNTRGVGMEVLGRALRLRQSWRAQVLQELPQATSAGDEGLARPPVRHPA